MKGVTQTLAWRVCGLALAVWGASLGVEAHQAVPGAAEAVHQSGKRLPKVTPDQRLQRLAYKSSLYGLLDDLRADLHPASSVVPQLELGRMEFEDGDYEAALAHLKRASRSIELLRAGYTDAQRRWPETKWLEEAEVMVAECLHRLQQHDAAADAYTKAIGRLRSLPVGKPEVLAHALHNSAALASQQSNVSLVRQLMEESAEVTVAIPGVAPERIAERLSGLMQAAAIEPTANGANLLIAKALNLARQTGLARRLPPEYLGLLHSAFTFHMNAGDLQAAQQTLQDHPLPDASAADAATGLHLALTLRQMELMAQLGSDAPFLGGWDAVRSGARFLSPDQQQVFAAYASAMAWSSLLPVIASNGWEFERARRSREVTDLAASLLQLSLPPEHPRSRLMQMQLATWQFLNLETSVARSTFESLLKHDAGTEEDAALRAFSTLMLAMVHAGLGHEDAAITLGKEALNAFHRLPQEFRQATDCGETMCIDVPRIALGGQAFAYRWLTTRLIHAGRLSEAQQLLLMLREHELTGSLRWGGGADARVSQVALTGLERDRFRVFYRLREQQGALAKERQALKSQEAAGQLDSVGRSRLQQIGQMEAEELRPALARFLTGLDVSLAARPEAAVVQNNTSVQAETTQIQRDIDQWARTAPQAKAVGVQYLVDRDHLSIIVTVPGLSPIARQLRLDRNEFYEAVYAAQTLLRNSASAPERLRTALQKLHLLLVAPIEYDLHQLGARSLVLSLDDRLRQLPFAALVNADGRYLVEDYAIALYNEAAAQVLAPGTARDWRVAAMGMSKAVAGLPALAAVPEELAQVVRASRGGGRTFLNAQFTRATLAGATVREAVKPFNVLHLASHFVLAPGNAAASNLFLGDGTSISLAEMMRRPLDFRGFELVVYSACESGIAGGRDADGMEMESLSALTRRQGAAAVLGTLWKVSDSSMAGAMAKFYGQSARRGDSLAEALRQTQLAMLRSPPQTSTLYQHPFHWAPFVLMGNWR